MLYFFILPLSLIIFIIIIIFQSAPLLQQTGFTTIPNTWDFVWKTSASCWRNQHIWHRVKYQAGTKGLTVSVVMAASWEVQCSTACGRILQNIECKSAISECRWLTCTYVHCWCKWFIFWYAHGIILIRNCRLVAHHFKLIKILHRC